jgi:hypothetical protein
MATVQGPLFSVSASGTYAGAITFAKWKGRQYARNRVDPSNPRASDQETSRNRIRGSAVSQHWANITTDIETGQSETDKDRLIGVAPAGQAWNGFLTKSMIGAGAVHWLAAAAAWTALTGPEKAAWEAAAVALGPAFPAVMQTITGGVPTTSLTPGEVFFHYRYGLYIAGLATAPGAVPPTYA